MRSVNPSGTVGYEGNDCVLPETDCVAIRFPGSHPDAESRYRTLMDYIENHHLTVVGFPREITLIDNCISDDPAQYVTEIRIPVARG